MTPNQQTTALRVGAALVIASGVLVGLGSHPATAWPARIIADLIFWPLDGLQTGMAGETRLLAAIGGGVMLGWGLMIWQLATVPAAYPAIRTSILVWFCADSLGSLAAGAWLNVLGNLVFLIVFMVALRQKATAM
ncbi:MAG: hypothetical protein ABI459_09820 [Deltaproteobacteria bacterium]